MAAAEVVTMTVVDMVTEVAIMTVVDTTTEVDMVKIKDMIIQLVMIMSTKVDKKIKLMTKKNNTDVNIYFMRFFKTKFK